MALVTGAFLAMGCAGNSADTAASGDHESALSGLSWEAEQGTLTSPFTVTSGTPTYVSQSVSSSTPSSGGRAAYTFSIVTPGTYTVQTVVKAATTGSNSFWVNIDAEPTDPTMVWDVLPLTSGFESRTVGWRGNGTPDQDQYSPKIFTLSAGTHTLIIRGREPNTLLDKVSVVLQQAQVDAGTPDAASSADAATSDGGTMGGPVFYVSRAGNGSDGRSWSTAWRELNQINWSAITAGATILIDGGGTACASPYDFTTTRPGVSCGMEYDTTLTVGASGSATAPVRIQLATETGRNGTAVFFGGRATPLPYCHQTGYTATTVRQNGILVGGYHDVVIDGSHRSGIMIYGAVQGVRIASGSAANITLERMEIFDNGSIGASSGGGANTDEEGISLAGGLSTHMVGLIIHDNGQDEIQDESRTGAGLNGLTIDTSWLYARREHPSHPGQPFNDLQHAGDNTCTHADSIQLYSGSSSQSGLSVTHSILGPLVNQGLYPSDGNTGATWNNVTLSDSLTLAISHNVISDNPVHGWTLDRVTLYAPQGGFEIPANGANTMTNVIKYGGYVYPSTWTDTTSGNVWYLGDSLPGSSTNVNPGFAALPPGPTPPTYAAYAAANFTPSCSACRGSSLHRLSDILTAIDALP